MADRSAIENNQEQEGFNILEDPRVVELISSLVEKLEPELAKFSWEADSVAGKLPMAARVDLINLARDVSSSSNDINRLIDNAREQAEERQKVADLDRRITELDKKLQNIPAPVSKLQISAITLTVMIGAVGLLSGIASILTIFFDVTFK